MKVSPVIYFGRLDFFCVVVGAEGIPYVRTLKTEDKKGKFTYDGFKYDIPNRKVTRLSNKEERRITEADEFGISFEPFKL